MTPDRDGTFQNSNHTRTPLNSLHCGDSSWSKRNTASVAGGRGNALDTFLVSLSGSESTADQGLETRSIDCSIAQLRTQYRKRITPVLSRPSVVRNKRRRRTPPSTVRRSLRINGHLTSGGSIKTQQRTLMMQLGIAREGEMIGDEAMQAYMQLFSRPLQQSHIAAIVGLFGWQADVLPLGRATEDVVL